MLIASYLRSGVQVRGHRLRNGIQILALYRKSSLGGEGCFLAVVVGFKDYLRVDMPGLRYKSGNLGAGKSLSSPKW